jgi:Mitochondrial inner membrane protein
MDENSMDPSDPDAAASQGRKRVKPPVIELEATDVTPEGPKPERSTSEEHREKSQAETGSGNSRSSPPNRRALPILSGFIGLIVGALALALVFLFVRGGSLADIGGRAGGSDPAVGVIGERVDQLLKIVAELEKRLATVESRPMPQTIDLAPFTARIEGVENSLSDLRKLGEQAQAANAAAIEAMQARIAAFENRLVAPRTPASNAAEIVALGALRDAIQTGVPFEKELAAVRSMLGERAAPLAPFEASAHDGLPTIAKLSARFSEIASKLAREPDTSEGYFARLWASAAHLVEVRPAGEVEGGSAGAIVARMEERLKRGDLAAALEEGAHLPAAAKATAADWFALASRRQNAEIAVKTLLNAELAALAAEPQK